MNSSELDLINSSREENLRGAVTSLAVTEPVLSTANPGRRNPLLEHLQSVLPERETRALLNNRGVPKINPIESTNAQKVAALAHLPYAYKATHDAARFAQRVIAQVRTSTHFRNPEDPRYLRFYYDQADVMRGGRVKPMPDFLQSLTGTGYILAGPSGAGKSAFLWRLRALVGEAHTVLQADNDAPAQYIFVPMLILRWPDCGTLVGLLANLRNALIGELGCSQTSDSVFANMLGRRGANAAIATCVFVNLGLLVLDGMCFNSMAGEYREILNFIATFKERSGIPTIISCTYPALQVIARGGSKQAHLGSAGQEYWDLEPPGVEWDHACKSFWNLGFHGRDASMPEYLPKLMWDASLGNMRIFAEGFNAIHHHAVYEPGFFASASLSDVAELLSLRLRLFKEPLSVMARYQDKQQVHPADLVHADYLPFSAFANTPSGMFERELRQMRVSSEPKRKKS